MASQTREWTGIQQFPAATQTKLLELLGKLKHQNVNTLTILVMGKGGVGKSSTVNSLIGERVVAVSAFQSEGPRPVMVSRSRAGFTLNIIDTPGLIEGGYVNDQALQIIKQFLLNKTIDVLLYVDRLDAYRVDNLDKQVITAITDSFGKGIWRRGLVVLTHAQLSPPDGLNYDEFLSKRSEALLKVVRLGAQIKKQELQDSSIPVILVENSGRCRTNDDGEKILPNGVAWIPNLVEIITKVVSNGSKAIVVDKKLIEGPNPNEKHKFLIPLLLAFQYFFIVKPIQRAIKSDIAKENKPLWELRDMGLASRRAGGHQQHPGQKKMSAAHQLNTMGSLKRALVAILMIDLYWTVLPVMLVNYFATHPQSKFNAMRSMVMISLTWTWSIRLSHSYLRRERWQCGAREDWRFTSMRKQYGKRWWWLSFFAVYISQQVLMMGVCLPMYAVHSVDKPWNMWDTSATLICVCGIICAYFADTQLHEFLSKNDELKEQGNLQSDPILDKGLWWYSRHPNYFGEQVWWWGLVVFGWNVGYGWTLIGSVMNSMCLAYVTGLVEQRMLKHEYRSNAYKRYQKTTSVWIPWFKFSYSYEGETDKNTT
ncbi:Translocase of chloroplast [Thalictrum thalictroides]|uniref:Translocase of chloroplast n=1 Tax=Thalictrum thalictroides TaxID=46969 RepID=A0A7J6UY07_THATH|nr:Translocase of chloroplast [Thalictrum thalictroides]